MSTNDVTRPARRPAARALVLLMVCVSMLAFSVDRAYAIDPVKPGAQIGRIVEGGTVTSTSPYTYVATVGGVSATAKAWEPSAGTLIFTIDTDGISVQTTAVDNGDGTITYTTTGPNGYSVVETKSSEASSGSGGCTDTSCLAVIGASAAATIAVCAVTLGFGCAAAGAAGAAVSGGYCELHDCESTPKCPDHEVRIGNATGMAGTTGRAVWFSQSVKCNMRMEYIKMSMTLFRNGTAVFSTPAETTCWSAYGCAHTWTAWNLQGGCFDVWATFSARWRDTTTNQIIDFGGSKMSNRICLN